MFASTEKVIWQRWKEFETQEERWEIVTSLKKRNLKKIERIEYEKQSGNVQEIGTKRKRNTVRQKKKKNEKIKWRNFIRENGYNRMWGVYPKKCQCSFYNRYRYFQSFSQARCKLLFRIKATKQNGNFTSLFFKE